MMRGGRRRRSRLPGLFKKGSARHVATGQPEGEQIIEIFDKPAADERKRAIASRKLFERSNQRCRHHHALGRRRDSRMVLSTIEQDRELDKVDGAPTSRTVRRIIIRKTKP